MQTLTFENDQLNMLRATLVTVAKNDDRHYLNGIHISPQHVTGTNGHRLARFDHGFPLSEIDVIIPTFTVPAPAQIVILEIDKHETTVAIVTRKGTTKTILTHIDGKYVKVENVIPTTDQGNELHRFSFNSAYLADVQKALGAKGCGILAPDNEGGAYTVIYARFPDLTYIVMPLRT